MPKGDVFPRRNLPGDAEDWGRKVEGRIEGLEATQRAIEDRVGNDNRAATGSLTTLAEQLQTVQSQQTTILRLTSPNTAQGTDFAVSNSLGTFNIIPNLPTLTFDTTVPARLMVTASCLFYGNTGNSATNPRLSFLARWQLTGPGLTVPFGSYLEDRRQVTGTSQITGGATPTSVFVHDLPSAGTYTFTPVEGSAVLAGGSTAPNLNLERMLLVTQFIT